MTTSTAVAPPSDLGLPNDNLGLSLIHKDRPEGRPGEEQRLHDSKRKAGLQHRTALVDIQGQWVAGSFAVEPKRSERNVHSSSLPMQAVGVGDETELVDARDESAAEEEIHECDEDGGALGSPMSDQGIDRPEDCENANNEQDQDDCLLRQT
ncbi:hypothetical protein MW887_010764 [Aspergillus wentii]|nr:hypothetical protein MW887_010764 [Aspergillus wentii]